MNRRDRRRLAKEEQRRATQGRGHASISSPPVSTFGATEALAFLGGSVRPVPMPAQPATPILAKLAAEPRPEPGAIVTERDIESAAYDIARDAERGALDGEQLSTMAAAVRAYADRTWAGLRPTVEMGTAPRIACRPGCGWCCHQQVAVLPAEAVTIARYVERAFAPPARAALEERLRALDDATRGNTPIERARLKEPCAFLVDGACSIYAVRPLRCRGVHSRDAAHCHWAMENPDEAATARRARNGPGPYIVASAKVMEAALKGLARACYDLRLDHHSLELTAAARVALSVPDVERHVVDCAPVFAAATLPDALPPTVSPEPPASGLTEAQSPI